jgi:SPP1 family predicted phage head-tail adaptor
MQTIGQLDRRITLRQRTLTQNSTGQTVESFTNLATVWASINPGSTRGGMEEMQAGMMVGIRSSDFIIRYRAGIGPEMEVVFDGDTYRIVVVEEFSFKETFYRKRFLKLRCEWRTDINN